MVKQKFQNMEKQDIEKLIKPKLDNLVKDYSQPLEKDESDYLVSRISELLQTYTWVDEKHFDKTHNEMITNYPMYKRVNVATFMTAFKKSNFE